MKISLTCCSVLLQTCGFMMATTRMFLLQQSVSSSKPRACVPGSHTPDGPAKVKIKSRQQPQYRDLVSKVVLRSSQLKHGDTVLVTHVQCSSWSRPLGRTTTSSLQWPVLQQHQFLQSYQSSRTATILFGQRRWRSYSFGEVIVHWNNLSIYRTWRNKVILIVLQKTFLSRRK